MGRLNSSGYIRTCRASRSRQRAVTLLLASSILAVGVAGGRAYAQQQAAQVQPIAFSIRSQSLASAISEFIRTSGWQVTYGAQLAAGKSSHAVSGSMAPSRALQTLLAGTGISVRLTGSRSAALIDSLSAQGAGAINDGSTVLAPIDVKGTAGASTEGTNSYTSGQVTVAGKLPVDVREVPNSISVVTRKRMDDQNVVTVNDALKQTVGVTAVPYSGIGDGYYYARGFNLGIQVDGTPVSSGLNGLPQFDTSIYDRVEVLKGPSGLFQGATDLGGVVNLVRKRPMDTFHVSTGTDYGSWDNKHGFVDVTGPLVDSGAVRGRLVVAGTDQDSFINDKFNRSWTVYGTIEADLTPDTLLTLSGTHQYDKAIPTFGWGTFPDGRLVHLDRGTLTSPTWSVLEQPMNDANIDIKHTFDNDWVLEGSYNHRDLRADGVSSYFFGTIDPDTYLTSLSATSQNSRWDWDGVDVHIGGPVELFGREHQLVFGANYSRYLAHVASSNFNIIPGVSVFGPFPDEPDLPITIGNDTRLVQYGIYGQGRFKLLDPLTLVLGGRLSNYKADTRAFLPSDGDWTTTSKKDAEFTPYGGLVYDLNDNLSVYASYSNIFLPQTQTTVAGAAIKPQQGNQVEAGIKGQFFDGALNASLSVFDIHDKNRAVQDLSNPNFFVAAGDAESRGFEVEVSGEVTPGWNVYGGYTYTDYIKDPKLDGDDFDPGQPKHSFKLWNTYNFQNERFSKWTIGAGMRAASAMSNDSQDIRQGAFAVFDAQVAYAFNDHVKASLTVNNIFDKYYFERVGNTFFLNDVGAPRNVTFSLRSTF
ncbi:MAG TPA: TonB-dependent siderophore receptor [Rhizobium sp.]